MISFKALRLHAGPTARRHIEQNGLLPQDIGVVPGAGAENTTRSSHAPMALRLTTLVKNAAP